MANQDIMWRFVAALCVFFALPSSARAQSDTNATANAKMLQLNEQGFSKFGQGDFIKAAQSFEAAHDEVPDPILRKNAAIAWFKAGKCAEASEAAVFFLLAEGTQRQDRDEARSVWAHCELDRATKALDNGDIARAEQLVARVKVLNTDERVDNRVGAAQMRLVQARVAAAGDDGLDRVSVGWGMVGVGAAILAGTAAYQIVGDDSGDDATWVLPTLYGVGALSSLGGFALVYSGQGQSSKGTKPAALRAPAPAVEIGWVMRF